MMELLQMIIINMLICLTGFGGGAVFLAYIHSFYVETGIITQDAYNIYTSISLALPGGVVIKMLTLIAYDLFNFVGSLIGVFFYILPAFCIIIGSKRLVVRFKKQLILLGKLFPPMMAAILVLLMVDLTLGSVYSEVDVFILGILTLTSIIIFYVFKKRNPLLLIGSNAFVYCVFVLLFI